MSASRADASRWPSRAFVYGVAAGLAALLTLLIVKLDGRARELERSSLRLQELQAEVARSDERLQALQGELARTRDALLLDRMRERAEHEALEQHLALLQAADTARTREQILGVEQRLQALRSAAEAQSAEIERARGIVDTVRARRQLVMPTVRVNAKNEVGSGTVVWSGKRADRTRSFVLTAWHIVKDNVVGEGGPTPVEVDLYEDGRKTFELKGKVVAKQEALDLALLELEHDRALQATARLASARTLERTNIFSRVYAVGCPLGYAPLPTSGEITSKDKELDGATYWMVNAPTIFGNSGGGIYLAETGELIGVLSRISAYKNLIDVAVPHMGIITPLTAVTGWLEKTDFAFVARDATAPATIALPASAKRAE